MLIAGFPAGSFAANCYLVADAPGSECLIVDPGQDAMPGINEIIEQYRLQPVAVLATHGHIDHIWSVAPVCGARGIPAYIHPDDRALLSDPARGLALAASQSVFGGLTFSEPDDVRELADGMKLELAGISMVVDHAPGHTPGSVTFRLPAASSGGHRMPQGHPGTRGPVTPREATDPETLFTGDLLFAGSIGRTDLPGGDYETILASLARVCLPLPDETVVLAGHGPQTTIGAERAHNPFLAGLVPAKGPVTGL